MKFNQVRFWIGVGLVFVGPPWIRQGMGYVPGSVLNGAQLFTFLGVGAIVVGLYLIVGVFRGPRRPEQDERLP